jgi:rubrerythrin
MDIFEYAMQMEKDGEEFYRRLAQQATNKGLKTILTMLADDEVKHYNAIKAMQTEKPDMPETTILSGAKNVFVQIKDSGEGFDLDVKQIDLYKKAQGIEQKSRDFYLQKADETTDKAQKDIFLKLADEEKRHYFLLDNIIELVSRPERWLENAEFYHLEEY